MKNRKEFVKEKTMKIKSRNVPVKTYPFHGNCKYAGLHDGRETIMINARLSRADQERVKTHECLHDAYVVYARALRGICSYEKNNHPTCPPDVEKACAAVAIMDFSTSMDDDPLLFYVLPMYGIGLKLHPKGLKEWVACILWGIGFWVLKKLSLMRGRAQGVF